MFDRNSNFIGSYQSQTDVDAYLESFRVEQVTKKQEDYELVSYQAYQKQLNAMRRKEKEEKELEELKAKIYREVREELELESDDDD